jgi:carbon storage regulator
MSQLIWTQIVDRSLIRWFFINASWNNVYDWVLSRRPPVDRNLRGRFLRRLFAVRHHGCVITVGVQAAPLGQNEAHGGIMLVLTRKQAERIQIGDNITLTVLRIDGNKVRIGIDAPTDVPIQRSELRPAPLESAAGNR